MAATAFAELLRHEPRHWGAHRRDATLLLLEKLDAPRDEAPLDAQSKDGSTAFSLAVRHGHDRVALLLHSRGVDLEKVTHRGASPFLIACQEGHAALAEWRTLRVLPRHPNLVAVLDAFVDPGEAAGVGGAQPPDRLVHVAEGVRRDAAGRGAEPAHVGLEAAVAWLFVVFREGKFSCRRDANVSVSSATPSSNCFCQSNIVSVVN